MPDLEETAAVIGASGLVLVAVGLYGAVAWIVYQALSQGSIPMILLATALTGLVLFASALAIDPRGAY